MHVPGDGDRRDLRAPAASRIAARAATAAFVVTPPSYRFDIEIEEDLIEEVARVHGFERIPGAAAARRRAAMRAQPEARRSLHALRERARRARLPGSHQLQLRRAGLGSGLRRQRAIRSACSIRSPASSRSCAPALLGSLVANVRYNLNRKPPACACSRSAACSCATPAAPDGAARGGRHPPADARRRRGLRPGARGAVGRARRARWISST